VLAVVLLVANVACASASDPFEQVGIGGARPMPPGRPFAEGRPGPTGGTILDPSSSAVEHAVPYVFSLGHCGLHSPVDVDGSFWDPIDGLTPTGERLDMTTDGEMINATPGVFVVIEDAARFRTETGSVVRFARHDGGKEFPGCD
jgi:hypothetical protein